MPKIRFLIIFLFVSFQQIQAQKLDSLERVYKSGKEDTNSIKTLREISYYYLFEKSDIDKSIVYTDKAIQLAKKINSAYWCGKLYALKAYIIQNYTANFQEAITFNFESLRYYDKAGNETDKIAVYINLGTQYFDYGQFEDAVKYLKFGLEIATKYGIDEDVALINSNLGSVYDALGEKEVALKHLQSGREHYLKENNELEVARMDFAITNIKANEKNLSESEMRECVAMYKKLYPIFEKNQMTDFYLGSIINIGVQLNHLNETGEALKYLKLAESEAEKLGNYKILSNVYSGIAANAMRKGDFQTEAEYLRKAIVMNDSLFNQNKDKVLAEVQIRYQTDKIESENALLQKNSQIKDLEISKKDVEIAKSNTIKFALLGGLTLIIIFTLFLYNRFKITNQQKKTIEQQKILVEIKQKEITDSIKYAKRLQEAILPSMDIIKQHIPDSFLLYKPKDIVAGDFYFFECLDDKIFIAVADCTGHGVPGAMVSVVCSNALHRTIREFNITDPGKILDKTREMVVETFEKSGQEVKDGMDIALCVIDKNVLRFAGANNPCWIIRGEENIILPADKQPIGKFENLLPYTTHTLELQKGDLLYIFTDGYSDQFGGKKGKKFKAKNLFALLKSLQPMKMDAQLMELDIAFENWKGNLEQIDDVCIFGIRK